MNKAIGKQKYKGNKVRTMNHEQNVKPQVLQSDNYSTEDIEHYIDQSLTNDEPRQEVEINGVVYTIFKDYALFNSFEEIALWYYRLHHKSDLDILLDVNAYETKDDWKLSILNTCQAYENEEGFVIMNI